VTIIVSNGYTIQNKEEPQKYTYTSISSDDSKVLQEIVDKRNVKKYINPNASFTSNVVYDENREISSVVFEQK